MDSIDLDMTECQELIGRIEESSLSRDDKYLIKRILTGYITIESALKEKNLSIKRLREIAFGQKPSKRSYGLKKNDTSGYEGGSADKSTKNRSSNKGRNAASDYTGAKTVNVEHESLKAGDDCPLLCGGKLYPFKPAEKIKVSGGAIAQAVLYQLERLRCNACGELFTASPPEGTSPDKYDSSLIANLAVQRYLLGTPLYRIERLQSYLGVPLPDSTAWMLLEELVADVYPVYNMLLIFAANAQKMATDDTRVKILSVMAENKDKPKNKRQGTFTNGIIADYNSRAIVLFHAGVLSSGKRLKKLLEKRVDDESLLLMCDAASSNNVTGQGNIIYANCLAHGRRKFSEIEEEYPDICPLVVDAIAFVYRVDTYCKVNGFNDDERLKYHQEHSGPVMTLLHQWLTKFYDGEFIAQNDSMGEACFYMLRHWSKLTRFLQVPGCGLDNNELERILKIPIRQRKNSMFFKTEKGAEIGSIITSLLTTAIANDANPMEYLQALIENKEQIIKEPHLWMPWNYTSDKPFANAAKAA